MKKIYLLLLLLNFSLEIFAGNLACPTVAISYSGSPFCFSSTTQMVTMTGTDNFTGGTFSSTAGLWINASTGAISPSQSTPGVYTVTYMIPSGPGCPSVVATANVVIAPNPMATISSNQSVCYGNTAMITFSGTPNTTVAYTVNGGPTQNVLIGASGTTTLMTAPLTVNTTYNLVSASSSGGCTNMLSGTVIITVLQAPTATAIASNTTICSGGMANITLGSNMANTTYSWTVTQNGVNGASAGSGNSIVQALVATGFTSGTVTYTITPSVNGCSGTPIQATITVHPNPQITGSGTYSICSGDTFNISFNSATPGTTYYWTVNQSGATGASAGNNNTTGVINQTLYNTNTYSGQVVYVVTPYSSAGCPGTSIIITVNVYPIPLVTANPTSETILSGQTTNIAFSSSAANTNYSWTSSANNVNGADSGSGNAITQTLSLLDTAQSGSVIYTITPFVNGCSGNPVITTVTVNPNLSVNEFNTTTFTLSPNPLTDILTIKGNRSFSQITVLNQLGQQVVQKELNVNEVQLDLSHLKSGIYFVTINSENKQTTHKIIKQ